MAQSLCVGLLAAVASAEAYYFNNLSARYTVTIEDHHAEYTCADELEALADLAAADVDMGAVADLAAADVDMGDGAVLAALADDFDLAHPAGSM
jgi:hypothetical protein